MKTDSESRAEEYYRLVGDKNVEGVSACLHEDVEFLSPLATSKGKNAVVEATRHFMSVFKTLTIRARFGGEDQAMIVYDVDIPGIGDAFPGASWLTFREGLIVRIQLFFDASRFREKERL